MSSIPGTWPRGLLCGSELVRGGDIGFSSRCMLPKGSGYERLPHDMLHEWSRAGTVNPTWLERKEVNKCGVLYVLSTMLVLYWNYLVSLSNTL